MIRLVNIPPVLVLNCDREFHDNEMVGKEMVEKVYVAVVYVCISDSMFV